MLVVCYIIVLIFEIFYYSLFMKFCRNDNKFWKYLLMFTIVNFILFFTGSLNIYAYLLFMILTMTGLKFIGKVTLYDMFVSFIMLLFKLFIELSFAYLLNYFIVNIEICKILLGIIKVMIIIIINKKLNVLYLKMKKYWNDNNFYLRYLFSILMFIYTISACIFLINIS